jgi:hypothetical protein
LDGRLRMEGLDPNRLGRPRLGKTCVKWKCLTQPLEVACGSLGPMIPRTRCRPCVAIAIALLACAAAGCKASTGGGGAPGGRVARPTFDPGSGSYDAPRDVTIACATAGASIHYTTDGTAPTAHSALYAGPVAVAGSLTLQALAVAPGLTDSEIARADYVIQGTEYQLPADRLTRWQPGVTYAASSGPMAPAPGSAPAGWAGGIPARTTVCRTVHPSGDATGAADTAAIQAAVDGCGKDQTVLLAPGEFVLEAGQGIAMKSYVTVRGSGAVQAGTAGGTVVRCASPGTCVAFAFGDWSPDNDTRWMDRVAFAEDAVKGAFGVRLAGPTTARPGEVVSVDEQYDAALTWYDGTQGQDTDYLGWGEGRHPGGTDMAAAWAASRPIGQAMEIAAIDGTDPARPVVTFTSPFHRTYRFDHAAHLARLCDGSVPTPNPAPLVQWAGLERLTIINGSAGDGQGNVNLAGAKYCWVRNVESHGGDVMMKHAFRCELRDSFVHTGQSTTYGGGAYGVVIDTYSADNLVENDIVWSFNKVMVMRGSGGGNVIGYNYMEDGYGSNYGNCQPHWDDFTCSGLPENGINASHMATPHEELFEGNQAFNAGGDSRWGNSLDITFFRNHLTATRRNVGDGSGTQDAGDEPPHWCDGSWACAGPVVRLQDDVNRRAVGIGAHHHNYSFVGNVLGYPDGYLQTVAHPWPGTAYPATFHQGEPGFTSEFVYEVLEGADGGQDAFMWQSDVDTVATGPGPTPGLLRDGNYDYLTHAVHWHGVGGTGEHAGLAPPAVAALPSSLYIPPAMQPPPFFGGGTWPWIDGSDAADPIPGRLPARTRFDAGTPDTVP